MSTPLQTKALQPWHSGQDYPRQACQPMVHHPQDTPGMPGGPYPTAIYSHLGNTTNTNSEIQVACVDRNQPEDSVNLSCDQQLARLDLRIQEIEVRRGRSGESQPE